MKAPYHAIENIAVLHSIPDEAIKAAKNEEAARVAKMKALSGFVSPSRYERAAKELETWVRERMRQRMRKLEGVTGSAKVYSTMAHLYSFTETSQPEVLLTLKARKGKFTKLEVYVGAVSRVEDIIDAIDDFDRGVTSFFRAVERS